MTLVISSTFLFARPKVPSWELHVSGRWVVVVGDGEVTYSLLCELSGALVLAVAEEFDDAALVWGETKKGKVSKVFGFHQDHGGVEI